jgi:DNA polymerase-3 subunit delta'
MSWHNIHAHDAIVDKFRQALARGKLASSFLFVGPAGVGKRMFALKLAQALLCATRPEELLDPCETCDACRQVLAGTHPDLHLVARPKDKSELILELFIGDKEHRGRAGLCHDISLKPFRGGRKIAIVDDADYFNQESANCLLKTLEEPPPRSVLILIGTSEQQQLPTIRSRCQVVRFRPLPVDVAAQILVEQGIVSDKRQAQEAAALGEGSLTQAVQLADLELREFRENLLRQLAAPELPSWEFAKQTSSFVDAAGKEAALRRARMKQLTGFAADFYRELLRDECGLEAGGDEALRKSISLARKSWRGKAESVRLALERCLQTEAQIERNANQAALLECWLDDLATIGRKSATA